MHPVFGHERQKSLGTQVVGGDEGMDVAQHLPRIADVLSDQGEQIVIGNAGLHQLHRRYLDALFIDLPRPERILGATDIADMADGPEECHQTPFAKDRRDDRNVK